jgi:hypothetical protein
MDGKAGWPGPYLKDERRAGGVPRRDRLARRRHRSIVSDEDDPGGFVSRAPALFQISLFIRDVLFLFFFPNCKSSQRFVHVVVHMCTLCATASKQT